MQREIVNQIMNRKINIFGGSKDYVKVKAIAGMSAIHIISGIIFYYVFYLETTSYFFLLYFVLTPFYYFQKHIKEIINDHLFQFRHFFQWLTLITTIYGGGFSVFVFILIVKFNLIYDMYSYNRKCESSI